ncbi:MAG: type II toxin-antitoxin system HicA family toxin [Elusimicrobia bacterium]|nr:type II toxin-antitoxin system HicA family toxin [Elusimicrobiota bacterium]
MKAKLSSDIKPQKVIKALERLGFKKHKKRGSHIHLKHSDGRWTQVSVHPKPVPKGTLGKILGQAEISHQEFLENL